MFHTGKKLRELRRVPTGVVALSSFAGLLPAFTVWRRCKISERVWSPDNVAHICALIRTADFYVSYCVVMVAVCGTPSGEPIWRYRLTKPVHSRHPSFGHGAGDY
jgi:hypothetical protein